MKDMNIFLEQRTFQLQFGASILRAVSKQQALETRPLIDSTDTDVMRSMGRGSSRNEDARNDQQTY
jgi:hypothetical protein